MEEIRKAGKRNDGGLQGEDHKKGELSFKARKLGVGAFLKR